MNAVIAVCSFCELHGPSVLFCTQAFREDSQEFHVPSCKTNRTPTIKSKRAWYGPSSLVRRPTSCGKDATVPPLKSDGCEGCTSMNVDIRGIISNDHDARISYVSSQYPLHPDLFSIVRQACVRSLSCEVCPGREGPIFFGDSHRGHVLSHTFFLKDGQARGLQSWYSIIIVMMDKVFLLNSWQFLVKNVQRVIHGLQEKALKVFSAEQSEHNERAVRLNSVGGMTLNTFRRLRGNVKARSIVELTGDKNVFLNLHLWFTFILKSGATRIMEKLIQNFPPQKKIVDLEHEEETEEGFIKVHIKRSDESCLPVMSNARENCNHPPKTADEPASLLPHITFSSLRHLYKILGYDKFHCLAYHTVVGNQIIIKSRYLALMKSMMTCLKDLIPGGCYRPIYYSVTYEDSWKCNFLGLLPDVRIPDHVHSSELHIQINVTEKDEEIEMKCLSDFDFIFHSTAQIPEKVPQVLTRMEEAIIDDSFPLPAVDKFLFAQREIWTNKAKVLFAFSRGRQRTEEESTKLLQALDAWDYDKPLLKFWMNGLSTKYKTQILSSSVQGQLEMK